VAVFFEQAIERGTRAEELLSQHVDVERQVVEMVGDVLTYGHVEGAANIVFVIPTRLQETVEEPDERARQQWAVRHIGRRVTLAPPEDGAVFNVH
jgi:hypothetical protein